tara:strand:- start:76 stop:516 length:441 start_codon:yes stop_codon:yes gene_type:complete
MIRLKNLISEQMNQSKEFEIDNLSKYLYVRSVIMHTNYKESTMYPDEPLTQDYIKEIVEAFHEDIERENIVNPETEEYEYDVTRWESLDFDCEIRFNKGVEDVKKIRIDFHIRVDEDGEIEDLDIQDPDIADEFGITEMDLYRLLN